MDPTGAAALVALLTNGGPWAVVVVVLTLVLRAWRSAEFLPKSTHDAFLKAAEQRYLDLLDRFNHQQKAIELWRENAERATRAAEESQEQHAHLLARFDDLRRDLEDFKDDFHSARVWRELGPAGPGAEPPRPRRPGAREREGEGD